MLAAAPAVQIIDNGDASFSVVGTWTRWTGQGFANDIHESLAGSGTDVAVWTFTDLLPGYYQVAATWTAFTNRASNAPFMVLDDTTSLGTTLVNQRLAPVASAMREPTGSILMAPTRSPAARWWCN